MARILVVDDDPDILAIIKIGLENSGDAVTALADPTALDLSKLAYYDLLILDIMMPKLDGLSLIKQIRRLTDQPIIFLTAKTSEQDILAGLGLGADDYLTKPFRLAELRARVAAHLRREHRAQTVTLNLDDFHFNLLSKTLSFGDQQLELTKGEYAICEFLARHHGQVFAKEQIYEAVFGYETAGNSNSVTVHIKNIRAKFQRLAVNPISTQWGVGYRWQ